MPIHLLIQELPTRSIALTSTEHALIFSHSHASSGSSRPPGSSPQCMVEIQPKQNAELENYRQLTAQPILGTLGLLALGKDVFICVVRSARKVAIVRPEETIEKILSVQFYCLNSSEYDRLVSDDVYAYTTDNASEDGSDYDSDYRRRDQGLEHPCQSLKKLLSDGTFYYSSDFDVTSRVQDRTSDSPKIALDNLHRGFLWNDHMIEPLVGFRRRLTEHDKDVLDRSGLLTSVFRGFAQTIDIPPSSVPQNELFTESPAHLTIISRLSSQRAGTRFNARGIDDDGNVANFVETETFFGTASGVLFSYIQTRGSVPIFWEQMSGLLPGQQKITITRSPQAAQPAFDKHFEELELKYGALHIINLLSNEKPAEAELSARYNYHIAHSSLSNRSIDGSTAQALLKQTYYDFHAETRGSAGLDAARGICRYIHDSARSFTYFLAKDSNNKVASNEAKIEGPRRHKFCNIMMQQEGVFRTNCLDCLDRTNLIQTIISQMALVDYLESGGHLASPDFWNRHSSLWADNGDALSKIYAGTGAIKSSFTRHGKMSFAGALADARKSATRLYVNNFADKGRQNTIDILLGRLVGQPPVHLYDPINDFIHAEMTKRAGAYSSSKTLHVWTGTLNLNGRRQGLSEDLSPWLFPSLEGQGPLPEMFVIAFQEIVELSPQQIMSTDPAARQAWEEAVKQSLNIKAERIGGDEYVLLQGSQLVGTSLSIFVKASELKEVKNVEGSLKKTGMSGIAGNKGAVAIRMDLANTSICFVTAHLAAGFSNYDDRNRDYSTISHGLRFQRNRSIDDHDIAIWLGDFNYRIALSNERARKLAKLGDFGALFEYDQLHIQMRSGTAFSTYMEAPLTFAPTYKYDVGSDDYDTSEKARVPAWTDRILHRGKGLTQLSYSSAPLRFSDHRPVYAIFSCCVSVIDDKARDALSNSLYRERRAALGYKPVASAKEVPLPKQKAKEGPLIPSLSPTSPVKQDFSRNNSTLERKDVALAAAGAPLVPKGLPIPTKQNVEMGLAHQMLGKASSPVSAKIATGLAPGTSEKPSVPPARRSAAAAVVRKNSVRSTPSPTQPSITPLQRSSTDINMHQKQQQQQQQQRNPIDPNTSTDHSISKKAAPPIPQKPSTLSSTNSSFSSSSSSSLAAATASKIASSSPSPSPHSPSAPDSSNISSAKRIPSMPTKAVMLPGIAHTGMPPAGRAAFLAMQKSGGGGGIKGVEAGKAGGFGASPVRQGVAGSDLAAQRLVHLGRAKDKPVVPEKKKVTEGLMDDDVGSGLHEVEGWKALEPE